MRKGKMVSLSSNDLQETNITDNVSQYSYLRLLTKFQGLDIILVENEERGNGFSFFKYETPNRELKWDIMMKD